MKSRKEQMITVALAGNPNVGKSTLFNALTGLRQHTGNWPGKTVGVASGTVKKSGKRYEFVDLPGTYAFSGGSEDEQIASGYILSGSADCTVVVCDGCSLERSLILALQILQMTSKVIVCVNLMDEARKNGIEIDAQCLSRELEAPVVLTAAGKRQGLGELLKQIDRTVTEEPVHRSPQENVIQEAEAIASKCVTVTQGERQWQKKLDAILVSRRFGIPIMLLLLLIIIWLTVWGANYPSAMLEKLFDMGYGLLKDMLVPLPSWVSGILVDGMYSTSARVISVMLPPMAIFFPLFTILEGVGYLPRMAFLLDGGMRKCGGCGKQALTLCMGLGCNAVGVMGCRIISSPRERLLAILTNAMVPCNGRFPTLILLGTMFFSGVGASFVVAVCIIAGVVGAMAVSGVLSKTVLRHEQSVFLMEMPSLRRPRFGQILVRSLLDRTLHIAGRALKVAAPAGALLWCLVNTNILSSAATVLDPFGRMLGMSGVIMLGFLFSLPANELFVPVVLMVLSGVGSLQGAGAVNADMLIVAGWTWQTAVCTMVFTLFHWPCATTLMTIHKETGSIKETAAAFFLPTAVGAVLCMMLHLVMSSF